MTVADGRQHWVRAKPTPSPSPILRLPDAHEAPHGPSRPLPAGRLERHLVPSLPSPLRGHLPCPKNPLDLPCQHEPRGRRRPRERARGASNTTRRSRTTRASTLGSGATWPVRDPRPRAVRAEWLKHRPDRSRRTPRERRADMARRFTLRASFAQGGNVMIVGGPSLSQQLT